MKWIFKHCFIYFFIILSKMLVFKYIQWNNWSDILSFGSIRNILFQPLHISEKVKKCAVLMVVTSTFINYITVVTVIFPLIMRVISLSSLDKSIMFLWQLIHNLTYLLFRCFFFVFIHRNSISLSSCFPCIV